MERISPRADIERVRTRAREITSEVTHGSAQRPVGPQRGRGDMSGITKNTGVDLEKQGVPGPEGNRRDEVRAGGFASPDGPSDTSIRVSGHGLWKKEMSPR
jgi:hypothetical protein